MKRMGRYPKFRPVIHDKVEPVKVEVPTVNDEEEDVLDVLIKENKQILRRKKLEETPRIVRPPIRYAKHTEEMKNEELSKELSELQEKVKEKSEMLEIALSKYMEVITFSTERNTGINKGSWIHILSFLNVKTLLTMKRVNSLFKALVHMEDKWEKLFYSVVPKDFGFEIPGSSFFEKYKFVSNKENHDSLGLDVISTTGGRNDVSFDVENMLYATYETVPTNSNVTPKRKPYSTKYGNHSNVDVIMRMTTSNLVFKCSIQLPPALNYDPVKNALVFVSENEFTKDKVKKIASTYNHVLEDDMKDVIGRAKREGLPIPSFQFFEIAEHAKEGTEEKRSVNRVASQPVVGKYVLLKMIDHVGKGMKIDICGFSLYGISKGF